MTTAANRISLANPILPDDEPPIGRERLRRGRIWWTLVAFGAVILVAFLVAWFSRESIAGNFVQSELDKRGVRATYTIDKVSFRTQRLTDVVIGDPAMPDLTARRVEVDIDLLGGPGVAEIRADGVRLYGRFVDGRLSLGELDKFTDSTKQEPLGLPDLDVVLTDARARLDTPWGAAGLKLEGRGNLQDGFKGKLAAVSSGGDAFGCELGRTTAWVDIEMDARKPSVSGPLRIADMACDKGRVTMVAPQFGVTAHFNEQLTVADATFDTVTGPVDVRGNRLASFGGKIALSNLPKAIATEFDLAGKALATPWVTAREMTLEGRFAAAKIAGAKDPLKFDGDLALSDARAAPAMMRSIAGLDGVGRGTPFAPIMAKLATAARRAASQADVAAHVEFGRMDGNEQQLVVSDLSARSASGARIFLDDGTGLFMDPKTGRWRLDGRVRIAGGDLPEGALRLNSGPSGRVSGEALFRPYAAGDARVELGTIRFSTGGGGSTDVATMLTMSGPFAGGRIDGVQLPIKASIAASGRVALAGGCTPLSYRRIAISSFVTEPGQLRLCSDAGRPLIALGANGIEGGATLASPVIRGRIGRSPAVLMAARFRFGLSRQDFVGADVDVAIGDPAAPVRMRFDRLDGAFTKAGIVGTVAGGRGRIANVPLDLASVAGDWRFVDGALTVTGAMRVADVEAGSETGARFEEMVARDVTLMLKGDSVTARGMLVEPLSGRDVASLDIAHRLSSGVGHADIGVAGLIFDKALQPAQLFKSALGVVANVRGRVDGSGQIRWNGSRVTSDGVFRTAGMDLAAPFGPVAGLATEVRFTDLLGLVTAPGTMTVASINPGIEVTDGVVQYRLLPDLKIGVLGARWPFVGGTLTLRPTVLDFSEDKTRELTFDIVALDSAAFLQRFEFDNITATGIFDGTLPVSFDQSGGRVNRGTLTARPGGGTIRYVGELSNKDLGTYANIAFGALKSLRYDSLGIVLDGRLDGEMVTDIKFAGLSQGEGAERNILTRAIGKIPFEFNIKITAPFRQLIFSARSYYRPELLIEQNLPALIRAQQELETRKANEKTEKPEAGVQPPVSEDMP